MEETKVCETCQMNVPANELDAHNAEMHPEAADAAVEAAPETEDAAVAEMPTEPATDAPAEEAAA